MPLTFARLTLAATALLLMGSCDRPAESARAESSTPPAVIALIAGTPAGDLEDWVGEIRVGLDSVKGLVDNAVEANRRIVMLYATRQEYLEAYYGPTGSVSPSESLGTAVKTAETRFHELMKLTSATSPVPRADVERAIAALEAQMDVVLREAKSSPGRLRSGLSSQRETP
jgi:hypothetical protein